MDHKDLLAPCLDKWFLKPGQQNSSDFSDSLERLLLTVPNLRCHDSVFDSRVGICNLTVDRSRCNSAQKSRCRGRYAVAKAEDERNRSGCGVKILIAVGYGR